MESRPSSVDIAYKPHDEGSHCAYCPEGQYSDGLGPCRACPPSTMPKYGLYINRWTRWPEHMVSTCMAFDKGKERLFIVYLEIYLYFFPVDMQNKYNLGKIDQRSPDEVSGKMKASRG
jgi:hypothetical protein